MSSGNLSSMVWRVGVDVGGTFTDMVVVDADGLLRVHKVPTVQSDPAQGVMAAVEQAAKSEGLSADAFLSRVSLFVHGSTIATNTVLEGKGARVGLLATRGFRDSVEIRRGHRDNPWDHRTPYAPVLVPRYLRQPVSGRLDRDGQEVEALSEDDVINAAQLFREEGVQSVAICLFNSYASTQHESRAADTLLKHLPGVSLSQSGKVAPVIGEYERSATAVLNAYVAPRTVTYLKELNARLSGLGLTVPLLLIQNNGGAISVDEIADRPAALLLSGPAAGVGALSYYGDAIGTHDLVSMEIGGTSCDVMLMTGGKVAFSDRLDIGGYTCVLPSVEVHTIGAGGGTIARVDDAGLLHVGPEGASSRPGPACYGLGGQEPTVTDAQVVLGRVKPGPMGGGAVVIDPAQAIAVIGERIAKPLGLSIEAAAEGIIRLMDQKLLHAVARLSSERGYDPRRLTLVAGGGAGPVHGCSVGRALGCKQVFLPRLAGAFCALGMLHSEVRHDFMRVHFADLDHADRPTLETLFEELEAEARATLHRERFDAGSIELTRALDLRYIGQQWDITVPVIGEFDPAKIRHDFDLEHDRLFGHTQPDGIIEITKVRAAGIGKLPPLKQQSPTPASGPAKPISTRRVWTDAEVGWKDLPVYGAGQLAPGHIINGPAVIDEATTTILLGSGDLLRVDPTGNFLVTFDGVQ
ncbi:hydantoinase/oxoprolinase family protein [Leptospira interrogans]